MRAGAAKTRAAQRARFERREGPGSWVDGDGAANWLVAPRPADLSEPEPCLVIGFFGQARDDVDHGLIVSLEHAILERAETIEGLLSYHNVRLANGQWGNLVLFRAGSDTASSLRAEPDHAEAVRVAPAHYRSLRLHRGTLPDGPFGRREVRLATTLYLDFAAAPPWRAVRTL